MGDLEKIFATNTAEQSVDEELDDETHLNLSTKTLLGHYAKLMREGRIQTGNGPKK
jgi:hypothetical protein